MTELHVERKERSALPWAIGVLLLALLAWFFFGRDRNATSGASAGIDSAATMTATAGADALPAAVDEFVRFTETQTADSASRAHDYTADGLRRLADAIGSLTQGTPLPAAEVDERLNAIRTRADAMQREPNSAQHALQAREAFLLASGLMQRLQNDRYTGLASEVGEVNDAATAVQPDHPLMEQVSEVQRFFERAANAVQKMARTT